MSASVLSVMRHCATRIYLDADEFTGESRTLRIKSANSLRDAREALANLIRSAERLLDAYDQMSDFETADNMADLRRTLAVCNGEAA